MQFLTLGVRKSYDIKISVFREGRTVLCEMKFLVGPWEAFWSKWLTSKFSWTIFNRDIAVHRSAYSSNFQACAHFRRLVNGSPCHYLFIGLLNVSNRCSDERGPRLFRHFLIFAYREMPLIIDAWNVHRGRSLVEFFFFFSSPFFFRLCTANVCIRSAKLMARFQFVQFNRCVGSGNRKGVFFFFYVLKLLYDSSCHGELIFVYDENVNICFFWTMANVGILKCLDLKKNFLEIPSCIVRPSCSIGFHFWKFKK